MKAIILLAGYATRMYPLTENQPKALLPIKGKPVIDYIIEQINRIPAIDTIYAVTNSRFYPHFSAWAKTAPTAIPIEVLDDGTTSNDNRLGAIGDIYFTIQQKAIEDELFIVAGDNLFTYDLKEQYDLYLAKNCDTIAGKELDNIEMLKSFAVAKLDQHGKVLDLVEKPQQPESNIAIYATYFYKKETAALFKQYLEEGNNPDPPGGFPQWLHKIRDIYAYKMNGDCYDIGTIEMYEAMK
ncbi:MAG: nucleotidyltransferase family protein [Defluviitaleaceae bacterium]|nr:nucleotidyltransferase family protein [Defluviitaleaceae bacterium]